MFTAGHICRVVNIADIRVSVRSAEGLFTCKTL